MNAILFDTETTGLDNPEIIEAAWVRIQNLSTLAFAKYFVQRYMPSKPITFGAMATHHIVMKDLVNCPPSSDFALPEDVEYLIGHNVDFDWKVIGQPNIKRICTLAMSRKIWPECDSHSQSALMYFLFGDAIRNQVKGAHSALNDVEMCSAILARILDESPSIQTWEQLWEFSEKARIPDVISFGKHKGTKITELPNDYKRWLVNQTEMDPYLIRAVRISMGLATAN